MSAAELVSGALFAVGLFTSGVYEPEVIKEQLRFSCNVMILVMLTASMCSAVVMDVVDRLGIMGKTHPHPVNLGLFRYDGNVLGGVLIGVGMALSGSCPGTSFVQAGVGNMNGVLVVLGGLCGAVAFVALQEYGGEWPKRETATRPSRTNKLDQPASLDMAKVLGLPPFVMLLVWILTCTTAIQLFTLTGQTTLQSSSYSLLPPAHAGMLIGLAQLATVLLTGHALGASKAFEDVARWMLVKATRFTITSARNTVLLTSQVVFSIGVAVTAGLLNLAFSTPRAYSSSIWNESSSATAFVKPLLGGFAMVIGARTAKGCTSGHFLSGVSRFSTSSFATSTSMFATAVAVTTLFS